MCGGWVPRGQPALLDVTTAAQVLGIGRSQAYQLVRTGQWPTPVLHIGRLIKIPTAPLLSLVDKGEVAAAWPSEPQKT